MVTAVSGTRPPGARAAPPGAVVAPPGAGVAIARVPAPSKMNWIMNTPGKVEASQGCAVSGG